MTNLSKCAHIDYESLQSIRFIIRDVVQDGIALI